VYDGVVYDVTDKGRPIWVKLGAGRVSSVQRRIEAKLAEPGAFANAPTGLAFQNGFLALDRKGHRTFGPLTAEHKVRYVLPCMYEVDAVKRTPPRAWARYLKSIWGSDVQSIELVHQLLGYLLSGRQDLQKIFVLLGPPRAGKGTLLNLIQSIFRDQATSFKVASLDQTFSMQSMLGKSVAYDPDVRRASSMFKSEGQMVERLLSISSHDVQVIPRKNKEDVVAALPARLILAANPPFGLTDVGGALASRFIILTFPTSFLGAEDTGLGAALEAEIPAIVALALDGLDKLNAVGRFIEPASSAEERESVERAQNPMLAFVQEECETGKDFSVGCQELWLAAVKWRDENGHKRMSSNAFAEFMRQRGVHQVRPRTGGERQARIYVGIRLIGTPNVKPYVVADQSRPIGSTKQ
jgi:putative DNA primase/helicase